MELKRLTDDDWADLLPGQPVTLGKTTIVISPLGVGDLKAVSTVIMAMIEKGGLPMDAVDVDSDEGLAKLFVTVLDGAPALLELASGLHRDDIAKLPIIKGIELVRVILEVNIASKEALEKNCVALGDAIKKVIPAKA